MQTPIQFFIERLKALHDVAHDTDEAIDLLSKEAQKYEQTYLRDVAEKAWGACMDWHAGILRDSERNLIDKQTYLNQNHPL